MVVSLEKISGLPITFDPQMLELSWDDSVIVGEVSERPFDEMKKFIRAEAARPTGDPIYVVWRRVSRKADVTRIQNEKLRYDLTMIPPGAFLPPNSHGPVRIAEGRRPEAGYSHAEFFRTAGHYHKRKTGHALPLPEVYEVLYGRAYWIIQRAHPGDPARLEEVYAVEAGPGEKAVMLPGFGHISVNAFSEPLLMANWIDDTFAYDYEPYERFRGGGYWVGEGLLPETIEFEKNTNYASVPELKKLRPNELPAFGLLRSQPTYALVSALAHLRFLSAPEEFTHTLTLDRCYRPVV